MFSRITQKFWKGGSWLISWLHFISRMEKRAYFFILYFLEEEIYSFSGFFFSLAFFKAVIIPNVLWLCYLLSQHGRIKLFAKFCALQSYFCWRGHLFFEKQTLCPKDRAGSVLVWALKQVDMLGGCVVHSASNAKGVSFCPQSLCGDCQMWALLPDVKRKLQRRKRWCTEYISQFSKGHLEPIKKNITSVQTLWMRTDPPQSYIGHKRLQTAMSPYGNLPFDNHKSAIFAPLLVHVQ